jgi:hypothetical protein
MDTQTLTHLSQMYASGLPMGLEINFATTSCDLRQKEQRRTSGEARFRRKCNLSSNSIYQRLEVSTA